MTISMRTAIIHDWLVSSGGAERVLEALCEIFPEAPVFTSVCDRNKLPASLNNRDIRTSFIQKFPFSVKMYREYLPLMPMAFESFDLRGFDLIISSSHACAKGVRKPKGALHICYCHTPMRYAWDMYDEYLKIENVRGLKKAAVGFLMPFIRRWDRRNSDRVDHFIANSRFVAKRIKMFYDRESTVINPPVDTKKFRNMGTAGDTYLAVSRLVPQKRTDIVIEAFNRSGRPLKVIGTGRDEAGLKKMAGDNIIFMGFVSDGELARCLSTSRALVFASYEDFGLVPLEAQAAGCPAIVYGKGGASESIIPGKTGIIFEEQSVDCLLDAVNRFESMKFDRALIKEHAALFDKDAFKSKMIELIEEKMRRR